MTQVPGTANPSKWEEVDNSKLLSVLLSVGSDKELAVTRSWQGQGVGSDKELAGTRSFVVSDVWLAVTFSW